MFDSLSDRLNGTLDGLRGKGKLSEDDINKAMREIRLALLEADVNFAVVRDFVAKVKERAMGAEVLDSLTPGQQVVKIVHEELTSLMGTSGAKLSFANKPPTVILLAGLQGSGKTTAAGKLARLLAKQKKTPALVAADVYRPAAIQQLQTLGKSLQVPVFERGTADPVETAAWGIEQAKAQGRDVVIVDTAGRLSIDQEMMDELVRIKQKVKPHDVVLVLDSMTGQDAVATAEAFREAVDYDGVILTKLDGDARGGAALAVRAVTGKPILYTSVGEKLDQLEEFHPERMASRILGMGDVMSLIERAQEEFDEKQAADMEAQLRRGEFTLEDFLDQLRMVRKMTRGQGMAGLLGMLPGVGRQIKNMKVDERQVDRVEAIILSMTPYERRNPKLIDGSRRRRIAAGSGTNVQTVNQLLGQFKQMQKMMKQVGKGKMPQFPGMPRR
ncbi:MAG TPA: signal recognition particle protein [Gaiellales bacterium]|jgi:signal recognition particle subunit SRP54|nr:signal recognition particle protein [Gaiellales bacterium]